MLFLGHGWVAPAQTHKLSRGFQKPLSDASRQGERNIGLFSLRGQCWS